MNNIYVPVSIGELLDKITILEIKIKNLNNEQKLFNVKNELELLKEILKNINVLECHDLITELKEINELLWDIEEKKRKKEKIKLFDQEFIELARMVYIYNDKRALIKKQINIITNSSIVEEKSYE